MNITQNKRPPVVVIMGHIDHGKSTLLDFIRRTKVAEEEAGGITQHISAYEAKVPHEGKERIITFIDTPGHEAFRGMRGAGGLAADIAVLVVSAEDGVKPQTKEALEWIEGHKLPFVVAFTKVDKPGVNIESAKQTLAEAGVYVEGYGGQVPWNAVSGKTGSGVSELLETILLVADLNNIHDENPEKTRGIIIEAHRDPKKGITATGIIKNGILTKNGFVAAQGAYAPLRIVEDFAGKPREFVKAGSPVRIIGWSDVPQVGSEFFVFENKDEAAETSRIKTGTATQEEVQNQEEKMEKKNVPLILRADTAGGLEALVFEIKKFAHERVAPKIIAEGVGNLGETDVKTAQSDKESILVGFHTGIDSGAKSLAERMGVPIILDDIIYKLTENLFAKIEKRAPKITVEKIAGAAKIVRIFSQNKDKQIVGGKVSAGVLKLGSQVNIIRRENKIGSGKIRELQYLKERINEAAEGREFGALIESKMEIAVGDTVEAFELEETQ
ncbi:MAG TPA: translation initiation factor IF-2 [Candidatus Paceibacterota bacterium]